MIRFKAKRAITGEEHAKFVDREKNPERTAFYQLAWHLGASQSDLAHLASGGRGLDRADSLLAREIPYGVAALRAHIFLPQRADFQSRLVWAAPLLVVNPQKWFEEIGLRGCGTEPL